MQAFDGGAVGLLVRDGNELRHSHPDGVYVWRSSREHTDHPIGVNFCSILKAGGKLFWLAHPNFGFMTPIESFSLGIFELVEGAPESTPSPEVLTDAT